MALLKTQGEAPGVSRRPALQALTLLVLGWLGPGPGLSLLRAEGLAPSPDPWAECMAAPTLDRFLEESARRRLAPEFASYRDTKTRRSGVSYYSHRAFHAGDMGLCRSLRINPYPGDRFFDAGSPGPGDWPCKSGYYDLAFARSLITGSTDFPRVCRAQLRHDAPELGPEAEDLCRLVKRHTWQPERVCARFKLHWLRASSHTRRDNPVWAENICPALFRAYQGDDSLCGQLERRGAPGYDDHVARWRDVEDCRGYAAFHRAYQASDQALCGESPVCWSLMGRGLEAAEFYARRFKEPACEPLRNQALGARCREIFSADWFLEGLSAGRLPRSLDRLLTHEIRWDLWRHYKYKALQAGDPGLCSPLAAIPYGFDRFYDAPEPGPGDWPCKSGYYDLAFARSLIAGSADFAGLCRERILYDAPALGPQAAELCAFLAGNFRDPGLACSRFNIHRVRASGHSFQLEDHALWAENVCPALFKAYAGDDSLCAKARHLYNGGKWDHEDCFAIAAFSRAYRARDPGLCRAGSGEKAPDSETAAHAAEICRLLMGEGQGLKRPYGERLRAPVCEMIRRHVHEL